MGFNCMVQHRFLEKLRWICMIEKQKRGGITRKRRCNFRESSKSASRSVDMYQYAIEAKIPRVSHPYLPWVAELESLGRNVIAGLSSQCTGDAEVPLHHCSKYLVSVGQFPRHWPYRSVRWTMAYFAVRELADAFCEFRPQPTRA